MSYCTHWHDKALIFLFVWGLLSRSKIIHSFYRRRAAKFDLLLALVAIEQWGFLNAPHLLWHRTSVYICHLRGPVTLTPSSGAVTTYVCSGLDSKPNLPLAGSALLPTRPLPRFKNLYFGQNLLSRKKGGFSWLEIVI